MTVSAIIQRTSTLPLAVTPPRSDVDVCVTAYLRDGEGFCGNVLPLTVWVLAFPVGCSSVSLHRLEPKRIENPYLLKKCRFIAQQKPYKNTIKYSLQFSGLFVLFCMGTGFLLKNSCIMPYKKTYAIKSLFINILHQNK